VVNINAAEMNRGIIEMMKETCWRIKESREESNYQKCTTDFMLNYFAGMPLINHVQ